VSEPTVSVCLLWAFRDSTFQAAGLEKVLEDAGIEPSSLVDPRTRIPVSVSNRLLELQLAALGDPAFGLRTGTHCAPGAFGMVEQLARSAPTLRESVECYARYDPLIQEGAETRLIEQGDRAHIIYQTNEPLPNAVIDFVLSYTAAMMRRHVRGGVTVEELWISLPTPGHEAAYAEIVGAPARFDAPYNAVVVQRSDLDKPMLEALQPVHETLEAKARRALERLEHAGAFTPRVRGCIRDQLTRGRPGLDDVARRLGVSSATLRRRLADEGTSFRELVDAMRSELAQREILSERLESSEIAARLGFAHPNAFYKAFKRWTGLSPTEYRASQMNR
jgi:AraC-like DNA-binding protein